MAVVTDPLRSSEARWSVGHLTYKSWRGLSVVQRKPIPTTQGSEAQLIIQGAGRQATDHWHELEQYQRDNWQRHADTHLWPHWSGNDKRITGYNDYFKHSVRALLNGYDIPDDPPSPDPNYLLLNLTIEQRKLAIDIYWTPQTTYPDPTWRIEFWISGPWSNARHPTIRQALRLAFRPEYDGSYGYTAADPGFYWFWIRPIHYTGEALQYQLLSIEAV